MITDGPEPDGPEYEPTWGGPSLDELADVLLIGPWAAIPIQIRLARALGLIEPNAAAVELTSRLLARFPERPERSDLLTELPHTSLNRTPVHPQWPDIAAPAPERIPLVPHRPLSARPIEDREDLLRLLDLTALELAWFADRQERGARIPLGPLQHYRYRIVAAGPGRTRLIEIPKPRLKEIQRRLVRHLIGAAPLHPAAHGSVAGRSVRTAVAGHAQRAVLIRCDLEGFFASISRARIAGQFRLLGVEGEAAELLAGLCSNAVPVAIRRQLEPVPGGAAAHWRTMRHLAQSHLPQGAPSSPGLANAIGYRLDHRLTALARRCGAHYTRYVDDLILSGPAELPVGALLAGVRAVVRDENFRLAEHKTVVLRQSRRQRVLNVVVNDRPTLGRTERDRLRAVLHNCATGGVIAAADRSGASSVSEFRAQLQGRLAWFAGIDPARAARLRAQFDALAWPLD